MRAHETLPLLGAVKYVILVSVSYFYFFFLWLGWNHIEKHSRALFAFSFPAVSTNVVDRFSRYGSWQKLKQQKMTK